MVDGRYEVCLDSTKNYWNGVNYLSSLSKIDNADLYLLVFHMMELDCVTPIMELYRNKLICDGDNNISIPILIVILHHVYNTVNGQCNILVNLHIRFFFYERDQADQLKFWYISNTHKTCNITSILLTFWP